MQIKQLKAILTSASSIKEVNEFLKTIPVVKVVSVLLAELPYLNIPSKYRTVAVITYLVEL